MAITSILELQLKPGSPDAAHKVIHETLTATRAFPGCLEVTVLVDEHDPSHVTLLETWESLERDDAYRAWRATPEGASGLGSVLAGAPKLTRYTLAEGV